MNERATAATSVAGPAQAPASFEDFYFAERPRLFRALLLVTHNASEAEEIMQDTFCRMWERWDHLGGLADPTGYLYRSAMNAFRSRYRRAIRAAKRVVAQPGESDPFEEIAARDEAVRALLRLTPRQRAAVVVTKLLGYSADDAALILGIRPGTVRSLISQARRTLNDDEAKHG